MMDFSGNDRKAKEFAIYYAERLQNARVLELLRLDLDVSGEEDAVLLARFYWEMLDCSALDAEQGVNVCGDVNSQYWMERLLNIVGGYLQRRGYGDQWQAVCDEM